MFYLADILETPTTTIGIVFAIVGFGAVLGSFITPYIMDRLHPGKVITFATILGGAGTFALLVVRDPILVGVVWGLASGCSSIVIVTYFTLRQRAVPREILGRAIAITRLISFSSIPVAAVIGGFLLEEFQNMFLIIVLCASVRVIVGICAYFTPLFSYKL